VLAQRNGHAWLARQMAAEGIGYSMADNAFVRIDDWQRAQELADALSPDQLHRILDGYAELCCPVSEAFGQSYHWSLMQVEYATDLAFRSAATLGPLYEQLVRESVFSVKAEQVSLFRLNHLLPRSQAHPEVMQRTAEFHYQIADAVLPQSKPIFDNATALDAAVDMLNPKTALVQ
jgi:hypothetical protein